MHYGVKTFVKMKRGYDVLKNKLLRQAGNKVRVSFHCTLG